MTTVPLTIQVDPQTAAAFQAASEIDRRRMEMLIRLELGRLLKPSTSSLEEAIDRLSREAARNGMTPEILESILADE